MFSDSDGSCVEFMSIRKSERNFQDGVQQTSAFQLKDSECQAVTSIANQMQTEDVLATDVAYEIPDERQLGAFLQCVAPLMIKQLNKNIHSHAFDRYDMQFDDDEKKLTKLHTLKCSCFTEPMSCTGISFNTTGSVIGVSYGCSQHDGWCTHAAGLAVWNLNRRDFCATNCAIFLETSACLTCIQFHPDKPALIIGGDYNGQLILWNLSRENDTVLAKTGTTDVSHSEMVSSVHWGMFSKNNVKYQAASTSLDGRVLIWQYNERNSQLQLIKGFIILAESLPKELKNHKKSVVGEVGVTGLSFSYGDPTVFFVGLEGGGVVQCSTNSQIPARGQVMGNIQLMLPIVLAFTSHVGYVNDIKCAPFAHHLFATCSSDSELHINSVSQAMMPALTVHYKDPLTALAWSPVRPLILAAVTSSGEILIFNLQSAHEGPEIREILGDKTREVCNVQFSQKDFRLLATGDNRGEVHVWQLSEDYARCGPSENKLLNNIGRADAE